MFQTGLRGLKSQAVILPENIEGRAKETPDGKTSGVLYGLMLITGR
jgi:hypothetical protein